MTGLRTVMLVTPYFVPHVGGVERYVFNLGSALLAGGHAGRVVVVTTDAGGVRPGPVPGVDGMTVRLLRSGPRFSNTPLPRRWFRQLSEIVADEDPDVVNAHAPVPLLADVAALAAGERPFVLSYHAGRLLKGRFTLDLLLRGYEAVVLRRTAARADAVVCSSEFVGRTLGWRLPGPRTVIRPGVAAPWLAPLRPRPRTGPALFVGSLDAVAGYKGLDDLLHALADLHTRGGPVDLDVVGDGDARERYEELSARLGLRDLVRFRGVLRGPELVAAYRAAGMFVLPTRFDSAPTVVVEAMASGLPVVSTRVGGVPEVVTDGVTGLLTDPGDRTALATAIARVAGDPALAARLGRAGRAHAEAELSWARQAERTASVYRRARRPTALAVVAPHYPPHIGGVENYAARIATAAVASPDLDAVVITSSPTRRTVREEQDGVRVVRLGTWLRVSNTPVNPLWPLLVARELRRHRVDVVNAHSPVPFLADVALAVAGRRPSVLTYHAGTLVKGGHWSDRLLGRYEKHVLPAVFARATRLVAVSPASLAAGRPGTVEIAPGVDVGRFTPPPSEPLHPHLLFVGRIERSSAWKGIDVLIEALAVLRREIPDATLTLVGDGDAVADHRAHADRLGMGAAVRFAGPLEGDDLVAAYRSACVVVLPSLTAAESFGIVLVEAAACARPVVASRVGGIPHVVEDGVTGLLVPPQDAPALAAAIGRVLRDPELARRLGAAGRRRAVERWSSERTVSATLDLVRGLARRSRPAQQPPADPGRTAEPAAHAQ